MIKHIYIYILGWVVNGFIIGCDPHHQIRESKGDSEVHLLYEYSEALEEHVVEYYTGQKESHLDNQRAYDLENWSAEENPRHFCTRHSFLKYPLDEYDSCLLYDERLTFYYHCLQHLRQYVYQEVRRCFRTCFEQMESHIYQCIGINTRERCVGEGRDLLEQCYENECSGLPLPPRRRNRASTRRVSSSEEDDLPHFIEEQIDLNDLMCEGGELR